MDEVSKHIEEVLSRPHVALYGGGCPRQLALKLLGNEPGKPLKEVLRDWRWACRLREGDLISGCTTWPYNTVVDSVVVYEINVRDVARCDGWVVREVQVNTKDGRTHFFPGGGCVEMPLTPSEVRRQLAYNYDFQTEAALLDHLRRTSGMTEPDFSDIIETYRLAMDPGSQVCDQLGRLIG